MNSLLWLLAVLLLPADQPTGGFPHLKHARFFPVCEGCHSGVTTGATAKIFPVAQDCTACHNGEAKPRVTLTARAPRATNVRFSHVDHRNAAQRAGKKATCQSCHAVDDNAARMNVGAARPAACMNCHARNRETHFDGTMQCRTCHVPLTRAPAIKQDDVSRFPRPEWHGAPGFLSDHGRGSTNQSATCVVCHARETCERCHANADKLPLVSALQRDARVAGLEAGKSAKYFKPASHEARGWASAHGTFAKTEAASCSNCHVQSSCAGCHQTGSTAQPTIAKLPALPARGSSKASVTHVRRRVHTADMVRSHGSLAATNRNECAQCHSKQQCAACHAGSDSRRFHNSNYAERHAPDVFASSSRCQSCHSTETFCRACHTGSGVAATGRMNAAFHDAQPMWILAHGQAARVGLDACAACHRQSDCTRCHSASGGWGVNPHRSGFEANRAATRSAASCRQCHSSNPLKGN